MTGHALAGVWRPADPEAFAEYTITAERSGFRVRAVDRHDGEQFVIKLTGVTREGEPASATNVLTFIGKDRISWQSRDRTIGERTEPDTPEVIMVRPPPDVE